MPGTSPPEDSLSSGQWQERETILDRFEAAWRGGRRPDLDEFRPAGEDRQVLAELVLTDLEFRLKAGEAARVEEYLARYPELAADPGTALDLLAAEYELRLRREPGLTLREYERRFPAYAGSLRARLLATAPDGGGIPGYEVLGVLGRGGMGVVYKARQTALNRLVALKMIRDVAHAGPHETARFRREAEAAARLQHPNIVQIYEVGEHRGRPYLALEYVGGGNLTQRFGAGPFDIRQAASLVEVLARAMHAAHQRGIIHRDLKPANVLLTADGTPKVTDFGLAKQLEEEARHTRSGAILGTPAYMAPEQAAGRTGEVGSWTDTYALGAILYELLTGRPPFRAETPLATLNQVATEEPVAASRLRPGLPRDLETICLKCLQKEPGKRYGSALALAEDLRRFLNGEPVEARPAGPWERGVKWARRRPALAALLAVSLLAGLGLVAGTVGFTAYLHHALDRRTAELRQEQREVEERRRRRDREMREVQYALDLGLASQAWRNGLLRDVREPLNRQRPAAGEEDLRGFEWYYLRRQCDRQRGTLTGHTGAVRCAAFAPDGRTLATGGADGQVILWDFATGRVRSTLPGHLDGVYAVALSPDGATLACATGQGTVHVWDLAQGRQRAALEGHRVRSLAISPDGRWLASGGADGIAKLWDLGRLAERATVARLPRPVLTVAFTPDSKTVACGGLDWQVVLAEATTGKPYRVQNELQEVLSLSFSPDGRTLAVGGHEGRVTLWDVAAGLRRAALPGHRGEVRSVSFSPDGQTLATAGQDATVRLWDPVSGRMRDAFRDHLGAVNAVAFTPDGATLVSAGDDGLVELWDPGAAPDREGLDVPISAAGPVAYAPDGKTLALAGRDRAVRLLDVATGRVRTSLRGHSSDLTAVGFSPDGQRLVTTDEGGLVRLWDVARGQSRSFFACPGEPVRRVALSPDGRLLAAAGADRVVHVYDLATGAGRATFRGHEGDVSGMAFSPDGKTLVTGCQAGLLKQWDLDGGKERASTGCSAVFAVTFAPDGRTIATGHDGSIALWDTAGGKQLAALRRDTPSQDVVSVLAFSPDGRSLASGGDEREVRLWDVSARTLQKTIRYSQGPTRGLAFSPDDQALSVVSADGAVRVWDRDRWSARKVAGQPPRAVRALAFSSDGKTLATGSAYGEGPGYWEGNPTPGRLATALRSYLGSARWEQATPEDDDIRLWDVGSRQEVTRLPGQATFGVESLLFLGDGRSLVAGGRDGTIRLWDVAARAGRPPAFLDPSDRTERRRWEGARALGVPMNPEFKEAVWRMAVSPDGKTLATAGDRGTVKLWDLPDLRERATLPTDRGPAACVAFASDGATLAVGAGGDVRLWDVAGGRFRQRLAGRGGDVLCVTFSPDGSRLAAGTRNWQVALWDLASGRQEFALSGHRNAVTSLAFSPDGRVLASGGQDGTVRLWRAAAAQELVVLEGHTGRVLAVAFSPNGRTLASGGETPTGGGEVYLWPATPRGRPAE